jgi:hypothetical protein
MAINLNKKNEPSYQEVTDNYCNGILCGISDDLEALEKAQEAEDDDQTDEIRERLMDCLDIEVVKTVEILISTGGPACKIVIDQNRRPSIWYQDWYKPWKQAQINSAKRDVLEEYVETAFGWFLDEQLEDK